MKIGKSVRPAADTCSADALLKTKTRSFFFAIMAPNATRAKWLSQVNEKQDYPLKIVDMKSVYCKVCEKSFLASQKLQIIQHTSSDKHSKNNQLKRSKTQAQLEDMVQSQPKRSKSEAVSKDLCRAMLASNIPWKKLNNPVLREFLERNIGISLPDESNLRYFNHLSCKIAPFLYSLHSPLFPHFIVQHRSHFASFWHGEACFLNLKFICLAGRTISQPASWR